LKAIYNRKITERWEMGLNTVIQRTQRESNMKDGH